MNVVCNFDDKTKAKIAREGRPVVYVFCNMAAETKKDTKKAVFNSEEIEKLIDLWHKQLVLYNCQIKAVTK